MAKKQVQATKIPAKVADKTNRGGTPGFWEVWGKAIGVMVFVLVATWIAYKPALENDFTYWDDPTYVTENPMLIFPGAENQAKIWREPVSLNYHPLTMYSLSLNFKAKKVGDKPVARPFIQTNILLHLANTLLVFFFAFSMSGKRWQVGVLTAALFGIHPMHVESVAWVSERKDVLYVLFFMSALLSYLRYQRKGGLHWYVLTLGLFVLSCLSKAMAVALPLVLVLIDFYEGKLIQAGTLHWKTALEKIPFFGLSLFFGLLAYKIQSGGAVADFEVFSTANHFIFAAYGFVMYWYKLFFPYPLTTFYAYPTLNAQGLLPGEYYAMPVIALAMLGGAWWSLRKTKIAFFSMGFYLATVAFVLQFVSVGSVIMADRYTYLPYVGSFFMLSMGAYALWNNPRYVKLRLPLGVVVAAAMVYFFMATREQTRVWQNDETLWSNVIRHYPTTAEGYKGRGNYYGRIGKLEAAQKDLEQAQALGSKNEGVFNGLGNCYGSKGEFDKAIDVYTKGLAAHPKEGQMYFNRGITYEKKGQYKEAIADYLMALPNAPEKKYMILSARGYAYMMDKQYTAAIADFDVVLKDMGKTPRELHNRGIAKYNLSDYRGAVEDMEAAALLDPKNEKLQNDIKVVRALIK
jgi:lipoprotein NlpI